MSATKSVATRFEGFEERADLTAVTKLFQQKNIADGGDFRTVVSAIIEHFTSSPITDFDLDDLEINMNICWEAAVESIRADQSLQLPVSELAALKLYTSQSDFYRILNAALRKIDRKAVVPFVDIIWLLLLGLSKCPVFADTDTVFRGVKLDLTSQHIEGSFITWHQFTSCSTNLATLQSEVFLGTTGPRSIFVIRMTSTRPRDISTVSLFPQEREVVFPPNTRFQVVAKVNLGNNLTQYQLVEDVPFDRILRYGEKLIEYKMNILRPVDSPVSNGDPSPQSDGELSKLKVGLLAISVASIFLMLFI
jgi:hypothetical protein